VSHHLDHGGAIASSAADLEILMRCLLEDWGGWDLEELATRRLAPPRLGRLDAFFEQASEPVQRTAAAAIDRLEAVGAAIEPVPLPPDFDCVGQRHRRIMAVEAAQVHRQEFAARRKDYGPLLTAMIKEGLSEVAVDYAEALAHQRAWRPTVDAWLAGFDAVLMPGADVTAPAGHASTGSARFHLPWSYAGVPAITVPCGLADDGLPVGLQFIAPRGQDLALLRVAQWCERMLGEHNA
jgi:Asp-tRNA(Asn)/Glu-tRNA(Gln) amidotransferase A subunit family amidase